MSSFLGHESKKIFRRWIEYRTVYTEVGELELSQEERPITASDEMLEVMAACLNDFEFWLVKARYIDDKPFHEIMKEYNSAHESRASVTFSRKLTAALAKLKAYIRNSVPLNARFS
jgi:hypothetical protein